MKWKILCVEWKDARGFVERGGRISAVRLNADELEQLAHEILRVVAECKEDQDRRREWAASYAEAENVSAARRSPEWRVRASGDDEFKPLRPDPDDDGAAR
jgi:hypothetical protein